jgi:ATP-binding cassette subfamily F protein 3
MSLLSVADVSKHFGAELVLDTVSFPLERAQHAALVGSNGAGKSTLLRIVAGLEESDSGAVSQTRGTRIAYLPQEPEFDPAQTVYEAMLEDFSEVIAAQERLRALEAGMAGGHTPGQIGEYGRLQALVEHTGYDYRERIERVLSGLGLGQDVWYTPAGNLSGGQRTRANLARTLLADADLLLLDEPTNHLDIPALEWLETYLRDLKVAFLMVAHDRYLLDRVTQQTFELSHHRLTVYAAPYSRFLELKGERTQRQRLEYDAQQREIARTEEFVRRYGAGQRSKEARGRQKRLDRLARIEQPRGEGTLQLRLGRPARTGDIVLEERALVAGYDQQPLVRMPEHVVVRRGSKIAIIGPNGSGKTTLLSTLTGNLAPVSGELRWGANVSVAYYAQSQAGLRDSRSVLEEIRSVRSMEEEQARTFLGRFLFSQDDSLKKIGVLSGGERSRVALAKLVLAEPNVLVLDEPTNHLDIGSREALRNVLGEFGGTVLFVSHDRYFIDALVDELWVVGDGRVLRYSGNYSDLAAGRLRPLDRTPRSAGTRQRAESPEGLVLRLEEEAQSLAGRLGQAAPTLALGQLTELSDRYSDVLDALQEAQQAWLADVRRELRAYSGSPGQSVAGRRQ